MASRQHRAHNNNRLLAYLLPLVKLNTVASDGWLLAGISGWLVLRWAERALGDDHHRLMLLRLHDAVVREWRATIYQNQVLQ